MTSWVYCSRQTAKLALILHSPYCIPLPSQYDFAALPIKGQSLVSHVLNLTWTYDLVKVIECPFRDWIIRRLEHLHFFTSTDPLPENMLG